MSTLVDFEDLYTAILEEVKIPTTDGTTLARIKRDINMIYLNHVVPFKPRAWWWLEVLQDVVTPVKVTTGTVAVAAGGTTLTFSSAPAVDLDNYYFKAEGYPHIIKISAHTAAATTATLETAWPDTALTTSSFKCWKDHASLASNIKDVVQVSHDRRPAPLDLISNVKFSERRRRYPELEGYPILCNSYDFDSSGNRQIRWYPACSTEKTILHIEGRQEATALSADADEPLMPVEDRIVLFYGGCSRAWARERNESEATKNWNLFIMKLNEMAAKGGDGPQTTEMLPDPDYMVNKRYRRYFGRGGRRWESD